MYKNPLKSHWNIRKWQNGKLIYECSWEFHHWILCCWMSVSQLLFQRFITYIAICICIRTSVSLPSLLLLIFWWVTWFRRKNIKGTIWILNEIVYTQYLPAHNNNVFFYQRYNRKNAGGKSDCQFIMSFVKHSCWM